MENTSRSLLSYANNLSQSAMAAAMANETMVKEALECAEFIRYVVELVRAGKLEEALWHLRCSSDAEEQSVDNLS